MKKLFIALVLVFGLGVAGVASAGYWGGHMMGWGYGGYGAGPGYGNAGSGYGMPCWDNSYGPAQGQKKLTKEDAETITQNYIGRNPNLKAGKIEDKTKYFETEIRTKDNSLVSKLTIDKNTGYVDQSY
ncbi:MAG: hypothetical protein CVU51_00205 [Deltaproteobacteria bacterium HGW-Deltaproteobacteria-1]|jgi:hypothetical protein|nr:MAG: hypothetical protein CVU51_00205 [Deltaproteobacteria bacterium HGW-Deltaproteobacteria-1]